MLFVEGANSQIQIHKSNGKKYGPNGCLGYIGDPGAPKTIK